MSPENVCRVWWSTEMETGWRLFRYGSSLSPINSNSPLWLLEQASPRAATGKGRCRPILSWMDQGWWTDTAVCTSCEDCTGLLTHGWGENCPPAPIILQFIQSAWLFCYSLDTISPDYFSLDFCFSFKLYYLSFVSLPLWLCVSVKRWGRQANVLKPTCIWIRHTCNRAEPR